MAFLLEDHHPGDVPEAGGLANHEHVNHGQVLAVKLCGRQSLWLAGGPSCQFQSKSETMGTTLIQFESSWIARCRGSYT